MAHKRKKTKQRAQNLHFPIVGGAGMPAKCIPKGERHSLPGPASSKAPIFSRLAVAALTDALLGGSSKF